MRNVLKKSRDAHAHSNSLAKSANQTLQYFRDAKKIVDQES